MYNRLKIILVIILFLPLIGSAQIINRSVINYAGTSYNSMFTFNAGEVIVGSQVFSFYSDKGFIQPVFNELLNGISNESVVPFSLCHLVSPVTEYINLPEKACDVEIYNSVGMNLFHSKITNDKISAGLFESGLYIIKYQLDKEIYRCKFLVIEK